MLMNKQREIWIDYARAFSILCVVLNHTQLPSPAAKMIYFLCLPAFFFCAGYLSKVKASFTQVCCHRAKRLLLPYMVFGLLAYLLWLVSRNYGHTETDIPCWEPLVGMLYGTSNTLPHNPPLWFLTMLFSLEVMNAAVNRVERPVGRWMLIAVIWGLGWVNSVWNPILLPWGIGAAMVMLPFYAVAPYFRNQRTKGRKNFVWVILLLMGLVGTILCYRFNHEIKINLNRFGVMPVFMVGCASVICLWSSLGVLLSRLPFRFRLMEFIGQNTLTILCIHVPLFSVVKGITSFVFHLPLTIYQTTAGCMLLFFGGMAMALPLCWLLKRYAKWLVGG